MTASLASVTSLGGCSGHGSAAETGGSVSEASPASGEAFPVAIEHRFGETTIDEAPTRIVTVGLTDQDAVLALGAVPVGTAEWFGQQPGAIWPWATDELGDADPPAVVTGPDGISFEKVAALHPDVILSVYGGLTEDEYDKLSQIAPTVAQPDEFVDFGVPWDDQTRTIGQALGRSAQADDVVDDVEAKVAEVRASHPQFDGATGVAATIYDGKVSIYGPQDARGRFLESLGFVLPPDVEELAGDSFSADVSMERVDLVDGDAVVWIVNDRSTDIPEFEADPLYSQLDVHTQGREVFVENLDPLGAATSFVTPLSIPFLLDGLVPQLAHAVDGDPGT